MEKKKITRKVEYVAQRTKDALKESSKLAASEDNDCVVYAMAAAFNLDYDTAYTLAKERFDRQKRKGARNMIMLASLNNMIKDKVVINGKVLTEVLERPKQQYKCYGEVVPRLRRVYSFAEEHKEGTYLILVRQHALVIKDGVILDNNKKPAAKSLLQHAFKVEDAPVK